VRNNGLKSKLKYKQNTVTQTVHNKATISNMIQNGRQVTRNIIIDYLRLQDPPVFSEEKSNVQFLTIFCITPGMQYYISVTYNARSAGKSVQFQVPY